MAQIEVQPGSNITVTVNKGPLSGGLPAGTVGDIQYNVDGQRFGNVGPLHYDAANAQVTMGSVGSIVLAGGTQGEVVTNLGDGVMGWQALDGISSGTTNIKTNASNIQVSVGAQPNIATITESDITLRGHFLPEADITYDLGSPTQRWRDLYLSSSTIDMGGVRLSSDGESIVSSGGMVVQGALVSREFYGNISGDYLRGDGSEIFNINGANVIGSVGVAITSGTADNVREAAQPNITSVGTLVELTVEGPVDLGATANLTLTGGNVGQFLQNTGGGNVAFATVNLANIHSEQSKIDVSQYAANVLVNNTLVADFTTSAVNLHKSANITGNITATGNLVANIVTANTSNVTTLNITGETNLNDIANVNLEGGAQDEFIFTDGLGNIGFMNPYKLVNGSTTVNATGNNWVRFRVGGTDNAFVVKENGLTVIGESDSNLGNVVRANSFVAGNLSVNAASNIHIGGGSNSQVLATDGAGNLRWMTLAAVSASNSITGNSSYVSIYDDGNVAIGVDGTSNTAVFGKTLTTLNTNLTVTGNLDVQGNVTFIESNTVNINDKNLTLANNAANSAQADGGGITIAGANLTLVYSNSSNSLTSSHNFSAPEVTANYVYGVHRGPQQAFITNDSGSALSLGQVVYISGSQGDHIAAKLALATSEDRSMSTIGFVTGSINNNATGWIQYNGTLVVGSTLGLTAGAQIYLSPTTAGGWTTTKPQAPQHTVILGWIERVHATQGSIYISVTNGAELDELHNVLLPSTANIGDCAALVFDSANSVWVDGNFDAGSY